MQNNDYIILLDENGQPYIEHALWGRVTSAAKNAYSSAKSSASGAASRAHKYLLKVGEGAKAQYAYTQAQVDALLGRGRQAVSNAASSARNKARDVSGASARDKMRAAENDMRRAHAEGKRRYSEFRSALKDTTAARDNSWKAYVAKSQADLDVQLSKDDEKRARAQAANDRSAYETAEKEFKKQYDKYYGDENDVGKTIKRGLSKKEREAHAAEKEHLDALNAERKEAYKKQLASKEEADQAVDARRRAMVEKRMADKDSDKADRDAGVTENKLREANIKSLEQDIVEIDSELEYRRLKKDYANTPLGKLDTLAKDVKDAGKIVKDHAKETLADVDNAIGSAKDKAASAVNKAKDAASNAVTSAKVKAATSKISSIEKMAEKYKRPSNSMTRSAPMYTLDKGTGETAQVIQMYDKYMSQANALIGQMKANAEKGIMPTQEQIDKVKLLYERSVGR